MHNLPKTDSVEELARFWDTHDLTDFEDELEEVAEPVFVRETPIQIHLQPNDAKTVQQIAQAKGVSQEEVVREWVLEKLARQKIPDKKSVRVDNFLRRPTSW
jgi:CopG antitoxin of type II toxin-antitoxin system